MHTPRVSVSALVVSWLLLATSVVDAQESQAATARPFQFTDRSGQPLDQVIQRLFFSGGVRLRPEYNRNLTDFSTSADDEVDFISARFRFGIGADVAANTGLYVEAQNNSIWGDNAKFGNLDTSDEDDVEIYQGYGEARSLFGSPASVRVGRQELVYGTEMLLGDADFGRGLSHDAAKIMLDWRDVSVHAWYAKLVERNAADANVVAPGLLLGDEDIDFWGVYGMYRVKEGTGIDAYWLYVRDVSHAAGVPVDDLRHTIGTRGYVGITEIISVKGEFAWQCGNTGDAERNIRAFAVETSVDLDLKKLPWSPAAEVGYAFATGDNAAGGHAETFNPLFQDNHPRLGLTDIFALSNLHAASVQGTVEPVKNVELGAGYYAFWVHKTGDASAPLGSGPAPPTGGNNFIGHEVDLFTTYRYSAHTALQLAWAHFFADDYIGSQFGDQGDADRLYLHMTVDF